MDEKEERKRIRRERIRQRYDNSPRESGNLSPVDERSTIENEKEISDHQITESLANLVKRKKEGLDKVTRFRIEAFQHETKRRLKEESSREERYQLTQSSSNSDIDDVGEELELAWEAMNRIDNPLELAAAMDRIRSSHNSNLQKSDIIIKKLKKRLIEKDEAYLENLRRQSDVTNSLQLSMDETRLDLQTNYYNELKSIEDALIEDRAAKIQSQLKTINELVENKANSLEYSLEQLMRRRKEQQTDVICNQDQATRAYNDLKNDLCTQVNKLECELAISRGMYQANSDQIEYNQRATAAKNTESEEIIKKRKKRIIMYKEELSKELDRSKATEKQDTKRNDILHQDCKRLEGQYNNLLSKLHRFEIVEEQKYSAAEAMHQEEINTLSTRILNSKEIVARDFGERLGMFSTTSEEVLLGASNELSKSRILLDDSDGESNKSSSNIWTQLESMLFQHHGILEDRERLLGNVSTLKKQNIGLKSKLDKLLKEDINDELIVPPLASCAL